MSTRQRGKGRVFQEEGRARGGWPRVSRSLMSTRDRQRKQGKEPGDAGGPGCPGPSQLWEEF